MVISTASPLLLPNLNKLAVEAVLNYQHIVRSLLNNPFLVHYHNLIRARTVESRWAMEMSVLPAVSSRMAAKSRCSFSAATLEVASSRMTMGASFRKDAGDGNPPLRLRERGSSLANHRVISIRKGGDEVVVARLFAAATTCSCMASGLPNLILFLIVSWNRYTFWNTMLI